MTLPLWHVMHSFEACNMCGWCAAGVLSVVRVPAPLHPPFFPDSGGPFADCRCRRAHQRMSRGGMGRFRFVVRVFAAPSRASALPGSLSPVAPVPPLSRWHWELVGGLVPSFGLSSGFLRCFDANIDP